MKLYRILEVCLLLAGLAACGNKEEKAGIEAPVMEFSPSEENLSVEVGNSIAFDAVLVEGGAVNAAWYVNGQLISRTLSVTWRFDTLGVVAVHFEASNDEGSASKDYSVTVNGTPLEVTYSAQGDEITAIVGTPMEVSVIVTGGDKQTTHSWTLDGVELSAGQSVSKTFTEAETGPHTLVYNGRNADGMTASKTWAVTVKDMPLAFSYTPSGNTVNATVGSPVAFRATVLHGAEGVTCSWKLDGTEVSDSASYIHPCTAAASYSVSFSATNAAGESASNTWTLIVNEPGSLTAMLLDAGNLTEVPSWVEANKVSGVSCVKIVDNPYKTTVNNADKVFIDDMSGATWQNSGYVKMETTSISSTERAKYRIVRVKVYLGANNYVPYMYVPKSDSSSLPAKVNGSGFYPDNASSARWEELIKHDDWNVLEYNVKTGNYKNMLNSLADCDQIQFRMTVVYGNSSCPVEISATNSKIVYFDDVEFIN